MHARARASPLNKRPRPRRRPRKPVIATNQRRNSRGPTGRRARGPREGCRRGSRITAAIFTSAGKPIVMRPGPFSRAPRALAPAFLRAAFFMRRPAFARMRPRHSCARGATAPRKRHAQLMATMRPARLRASSRPGAAGSAASVAVVPPPGCRDRQERFCYARGEKISEESPRNSDCTWAIVLISKRLF